jgi:hypothetical protein
LASEPICKMENVSAISLLSSMITPVVLILACGSLSLTTSQRLSRSIDRTRKIASELREIKQGNKKIPEEEMQMLYLQMSAAGKRAILMQKAMSLLYIALFFFIATSLFIGLLEILNWNQSLISIILALAGAVAFLSASIFLIMETRLALTAVKSEMSFRLFAHSAFNQEMKGNERK